MRIGGKMFLKKWYAFTYLISLMTVQTAYIVTFIEEGSIKFLLYTRKNDSIKAYCFVLAPLTMIMKLNFLN